MGAYPHTVYMAGYSRVGLDSNNTYRLMEDQARNAKDFTDGVAYLLGVRDSVMGASPMTAPNLTATMGSLFGIINVFWYAPYDSYLAGVAGALGLMAPGNTPLPDRITRPDTLSKPQPEQAAYAQLLGNRDARGVLKTRAQVKAELLAIFPTMVNLEWVG